MEDFRIKEILYQKGWKSKELAEKLGKSLQYISRIHRSDAGISIPRFQEIAETIPLLFPDFTVEPGSLVCPCFRENTKD